MKVKLLLFAVTVFVLSCSFPAAAVEQKFKDFTIDVPESCTAEEKERTVTVTCQDNTFFALSLGPAGTLKGREAADEFARHYKGNTPMLNDYGNYFFDTEWNGISMKVELIQQEGLILTYISRNIPDGWPEALSKAFDSITGNTPATDDFVKKYLLSPPNEPVTEDPGQTLEREQEEKDG